MLNLIAVEPLSKGWAPKAFGQRARSDEGEWRISRQVPKWNFIVSPLPNHCVFVFQQHSYGNVFEGKW